MNAYIETHLQDIQDSLFERFAIFRASAQRYEKTRDRLGQSKKKIKENWKDSPRGADLLRILYKKCFYEDAFRGDRYDREEDDGGCGALGSALAGEDGVRVNVASSSSGYTFWSSRLRALIRPCSIPQPTVLGISPSMSEPSLAG